MVAAVMSMSKQSPEYCFYTSCKVDRDVLRVVKEAAAKEQIKIQEWVSDLLNANASKVVGRPPIKRKPPKPRDEK